MNINFIDEESYNYLIRDTLSKQIKVTAENILLTKIFEQKFPKKVTKHCINAKIYENDSVRKISYCDKKNNIKLIDKKFNFYIFKLEAFEINNYLLFNTDNETIIFTSNFPQILKDGKVILDFGYEYQGGRILNFYFLENKKIEYFEYRIPLQYQIRDFKILKSHHDNPRIVVDIIRYGYKEVSNKQGFGKKYVYDSEKTCRKLLMLN